jgi:hypothetical protein
MILHFDLRLRTQNYDEKKSRGSKFAFSLGESGSGAQNPFLFVG